MKLVGVDAPCIVVELNPADCLALHDACRADSNMTPLKEALGAALLGLALYAYRTDQPNGPAWDYSETGLRQAWGEPVKEASK